MAGRTVAAAVIIRHRPFFEQIPSFFFLISLISWKRPKNRDVTMKMKLQIEEEAEWKGGDQQNNLMR